MRLNYQITVSFIPFMMFICITLGLIQVALLYQSRMDAARSSLDVIAHLQVNRIEENLQLQQTLMESLTSRTKLRRSMADWTANRDPLAHAAAAKIIRDAVSGTRNVLTVQALSPAGEVIASTEELAPGSKYVLPALINDFGMSDLAGLSEIQSPLFESNREKSLAQVLIGKARLNDEVVGYIVAEVAPIVFRRMTEDYISMGATGETLVAQRDANGDAVFLSPLRFRADSRSGGMVPGSARQAPVVQALAGNETFFRSAPDYRGVPVVAVTRLIPGYDLAIVAKMDHSEVLQPVLRSLLVTVVILLVIFAILLVISHLLARSIAKPLEQLTHDTQELLKKRGIWRAPRAHMNEVEILGDTIKQLLDSLYRAEQNLTEQQLQASRARKAEGAGPDDDRG